MKYANFSIVSLPEDVYNASYGYLIHSFKIMGKDINLAFNFGEYDKEHLRQILLEEVDEVIYAKMDKVKEKVARPYAIMKKYEAFSETRDLTNREQKYFDTATIQVQKYQKTYGNIKLRR